MSLKIAPAAKRPKLSAPPPPEEAPGAEEGDEDAGGAEAHAEGDEQTIQEVEEDEKADKRPKIQEPIIFRTVDTTPNVMQSTFGGILMALSESGFSYLLAGARGSVGFKSGRYVFEVKICEYVSTEDAPNTQNLRITVPKHYLRMGFSTAGTLPLIGDTSDSFCFDSEGNFMFNKKRSPVASQTIQAGDVLAILVNLAGAGSSSNTISMFKDGTRITEPQPIPENLHGKVLFPTITFKGVSVRVNFGPTFDMPLAFKCRMMQDARVKDVLKTTPYEPEDGRHSIIFPVCLPDEGTFDWCDQFLEHNPHYTEVSDRKIMEWGVRSGLFRQHKTWDGNAQVSTKDSPDMGFGIRSIDNGDAKKLLTQVIALQDRDVVLMEVLSNLLPTGRKEALSHLIGAQAKKVAIVMMGEPNASFRARVGELILTEKQEKMDAEHKDKLKIKERKKKVEEARKEADKRRKQAMARNQKYVEERKRKLEAERQQKIKEMEMRRAHLRRQREQAARAQNGEEEVKEEVKEEEKEEEKKEEDVKEEEEDEKIEEEEEDEPAPKATLTPEEKRLWFRKGPVPDMDPSTVSASFTEFSIPKQEEGFDEIRYEWNTGEDTNTYLRSWISQRKATMRMEDIIPSEWFKEELLKWTTDLAGWQYQAEEHQKQETAKAEAKQAGTYEDKENKSVDQVVEDTIKILEMDIFGLENIEDVGEGRPMFAKFEIEDWAMANLRFELNLLIRAFHKDVEDPERRSIHLEHLPFYYLRFFKKELDPSLFGTANMDELFALIGDTIFHNPLTGMVESLLLQDTLESYGIFVKLAEESRADRQAQILSGDESARLKIERPDVVLSQQPLTTEEPLSQEAQAEQRHMAQVAHNQMILGQHPKQMAFQNKWQQKAQGRNNEEQKGKWQNWKSPNNKWQEQKDSRERDFDKHAWWRNQNNNRWNRD